MIHSVWLSSFRCLGENRLSFDDDPVISVLSPNNVGKTSLLEACYLLGNLTSCVTKKLEHVVPFGADASDMGMKVTHDEAMVHYYLTVNAEGKKTMTVNGDVVRRASMVRFLCQAHYISADGLFYITSSPSFRRARLDQGVSQCFNAYHRDVVAYHRLYLQKNKMLATGGDRRVISSMNQLLAPLIQSIQTHRVEYLTQIQHTMSSLMASIPLPIKGVDIQYYAKCHPTDSVSHIESLLHQVMDKEYQVRSSIIGPHRDDYAFLSDGKIIKEFYSRGTGRVVSYFFQLAQAVMVKHYTKRPMLLLLDEPFAEIHSDLKHHLIQTIPDSMYAVYASTQMSESELLTHTRQYGIKDGKLCDH